MLATFESYRKQVGKHLHSYTHNQFKRLDSVNSWAPDVERRLSQVLTKGKLMRGSLVCFAYMSKAKKLTSDVIKVASAIELIHAALLVHDDIMDQDTLRRGQRTIYAQYQDLAVRTNCRNPDHFGKALGMCVGDILIFLGFQLIGSLQTLNAKQAQRVVEYCSSELSAVALAQMQDMYFGASRKKIVKIEILKMYTYKTARYSFSLPLAVGAIMAGSPARTRQYLEEFGEALGLLFQLKDDELGLFGDTTKTGKPVGSDVRQGKRTLYFAMLLERASKQDLKSLKKIFGNSTVNKKHVTYVQSLIKKYGIQQNIFTLQKQYKKKAHAVLNKIPLKTSTKLLLGRLVEHGLLRTV